ncbi:putative dihydroflavonol-4-reductase [Balamuthia mandrillaris]
MLGEEEFEVVDGGLGQDGSSMYDGGMGSFHGRRGWGGGEEDDRWDHLETGMEREKERREAEGEAEGEEPDDRLVLVTGATGLIGNAVARQLLARGRKVRAMVRDVQRARQCLPMACEVVRGSLGSREAIERAMEDCSIVYHCAGLPEQWSVEASNYHNANVQGTKNVVDVAVALDVQKLVYTSTVQVFAHQPGVSFTEAAPLGYPDANRSTATPYERSMMEAERIVLRAIKERDLPAVILYCAPVYGPGPASSPGLNDYILRLSRGELSSTASPGTGGGLPLLYSEDCARGHILAERKATIGGRYILSDSYYTLEDIASYVRGICPSFGSSNGYHHHHSNGFGASSGSGGGGLLNQWVAQTVSAAQEAWATMTNGKNAVGVAPFPSAMLRYAASHALPSAEKAGSELEGWRPLTPLFEGLHDTILYSRSMM